MYIAIAIEAAAATVIATTEIAVAAALRPIFFDFDWQILTASALFVT